MTRSWKLPVKTVGCTPARLARCKRNSRVRRRKEQRQATVAFCQGDATRFFPQTLCRVTTGRPHAFRDMAQKRTASGQDCVVTRVAYQSCAK